MTEVRLATVIGNPKAGSRTLMAGSALTTALANQLRLAPDIRSSDPVISEPIDLAVLASGLLAPWLLSKEASAAADSVKSADLLVLATPTYKASYTGLLKLFLDIFPAGSMSRTVVVPLTVAGGPAHRHLADLQLRPILAELGAVLPSPSLLLEEGDLDDIGSVVTAYAAQHAPILAANVAACRRNATDPGAA